MENALQLSEQLERTVFTYWSSTGERTIPFSDTAELRRAVLQPEGIAPLTVEAVMLVDDDAFHPTERAVYLWVMPDGADLEESIASTRIALPETLSFHDGVELLIRLLFVKGWPACPLSEVLGEDWESWAANGIKGLPRFNGIDRNNAEDSSD